MNLVVWTRNSWRDKIYGDRQKPAGNFLFFPRVWINLLRTGSIPKGPPRAAEAVAQQPTGSQVSSLIYSVFTYFWMNPALLVIELLLLSLRN